MKSTDVEVYIDGACKGNGADNSVSSIGIFWPSNHSLNVKKRLPEKTNSQAELVAAITALEIVMFLQNDFLDLKFYVMILSN